MEKITEKIAALPPGSNFFSLEFFPPKTTMGTSNLRARLDRMSRALRPLFVTVTWGAGGSTATKSMELAELCQRHLGLTTCLHLTCTNMSRILIDQTLKDAKASGIRNILALRGDPPRNEEYRELDEKGTQSEATQVDFEWAIDLVRYIRRTHGDYFCIGVAAYPEGHTDEEYSENQSVEHDLPYLVEKTQAGADFIMTQLFFDVALYESFEKWLRNHPSGVFKTIPIIPGLMPIQSYQMIKRTAKLSHANLPADIQAKLDPIKGDDEMVKKVGVDILTEIVLHLKAVETASRGPRGFHFYTLNLEKAVSFILERTKLIPEILDTQDEDGSAISFDSESPPSASHIVNNGIKKAGRRESSVGSAPHNRVIIQGPKAKYPDVEATEAEAAVPAEAVNTRANTLAISEGEGSLGREATWDDFPNGRWGDARSPAYGEIDGYGVSLHMSVNQAIKYWGSPASKEDITNIFIAHLEGRLKAIPWSEQGLNEETNTITPQLLHLNKRGWWTVASQPAVNGVRSSDPMFGWGPKNGFVFQKAFVELFLSASDWKALEKKLRAPENKETVSFYAANSAGSLCSSDNASPPSSPLSAPGHSQSTPQDPKLNSITPPEKEKEKSQTTNAVTWGAFPGKEIITPTIIEEVSFKAWAEEAFSIWEEWARVYPPKSRSRQVVEETGKDAWLVNIICHRFIERDGLWRLLDCKV